MKTSRISRIVRILTALQSGRNYSVDQLAEVVGVSRRTVFRDLKELEASGVPYKFDSASGGYRIDPEYFLPSIDLNLQEALSLLMLVYKGRSHLPLPFKNAALLAGMKIENNLPDQIQQYCNSALDNVSIHRHSHVPMKQLDSVFSVLQSAIRKKRKIKMHYHSIYDGGDIKLTLSPYHLFYNHRAWYVAGRSGMHKEVRTFKLSRIKTLQLANKCFLVDKKFDINEYLGRAWSMIPDGNIYNVKLRFTSKVARNVSEVRWHQTQKVTFEDDGSALVEFRVDGIGEIGWWILGYGDQVEVIRPVALRRKIAAVAKQMMKINGG